MLQIQINNQVFLAERAVIIVSPVGCPPVSTNWGIIPDAVAETADWGTITGVVDCAKDFGTIL